MMKKRQVVGKRESSSSTTSSSMVRCVRYAECHKNHAVNTGGYAVDGCREFMASGEKGISALTCSACGCHRSFHERVEEIEESIVVREENEKKRRKLKSKVWEDFKMSKGEDGKQWAICKHCGGKFDGSSKKGTTHLKNHLESKICQSKRIDGDVNGDKSTKTRDLATPVVMNVPSHNDDVNVVTESTSLPFDMAYNKSDVEDPIKEPRVWLGTFEIAEDAATKAKLNFPKRVQCTSEFVCLHSSSRSHQNSRPVMSPPPPPPSMYHNAYPDLLQMHNFYV